MKILSHQSEIPSKIVLSTYLQRITASQHGTQYSIHGTLLSPWEFFLESPDYHFPGISFFFSHTVLSNSYGLTVFTYD